MINPKEISSKKFEKSAFGYKPDEVDEFLRDIAIEYTQILKDKEESDKKIEVLADKIREYRKDEEALKEALLGAQRQGHQVVQEAEAKAERIIADANVNAENRLGALKYQIDAENDVLNGIKQQVSDFKASLLGLYKEHLDLITAIPSVEEKVEETEEQIEVIQETMEEEVSEIIEENNSLETSVSKDEIKEPVLSASHDSKFGELKFGSNSLNN